jgi:hypothetical protein
MVLTWNIIFVTFSPFLLKFEEPSTASEVLENNEQNIPNHRKRQKQRKKNRFGYVYAHNSYRLFEQEINGLDSTSIQLTTRKPNITRHTSIITVPPTPHNTITNPCDNFHHTDPIDWPVFQHSTMHLQPQVRAVLPMELPAHIHHFV